MSIALAPVAAPGAFGAKPAAGTATASTSTKAVKQAYSECEDAAQQAVHDSAAESHKLRQSRNSGQAVGHPATVAGAKSSQAAGHTATVTRSDPKQAVKHPAAVAASETEATAPAAVTTGTKSGAPAEQPAGDTQTATPDVATPPPTDPANAGGVITWLMNALRPAMQAPAKEGDIAPSGAPAQNVAVVATKVLPQLVAPEAESAGDSALVAAEYPEPNLAPSLRKVSAGTAGGEPLDNAVAQPSAQQSATAMHLAPIAKAEAAMGGSDAVAHSQLLQGLANQAAPLQLDDPNWPTAMSGHLQLQLEKGVQEARLELHPRDWGSVQIQVRIVGNEAQVQFNASHPQARAALTAGLPELRALMGGDGLVTQAQVGKQSDSRGNPTRGASRRGGFWNEDDASAASPPVRVVRIGLVDNFA